MIVIDRPPINVTDKPLADWLQKAFLLLQKIKQTQTISVSSTPYTVGTDGDVFLVDATSSAITVTLPSASGNQNVIYTIKKIDSSGNAVTIDATEDIDGGTLSITTQYDTYRVISDGTEWFTI